MTTPLTCRLDGTVDVDPGVVGGKAAGLAFLTDCGVDIPPAFALTTAAFDAAVSEELLAEVDASIGELDPDAPVSRQEELAREVREVVLAAQVPPEVRDEVAAAYGQLCADCGDPDTAVAVRSSALGEDAEGRSFAGEYDTHLWVTGADAVVDAVRQCWASLWTARAIAYRRKAPQGERERMGVVVQQMVDARAAGVFMTLNPVNGDRSKIVIEAVWGLGEPLVQGTVDPDRWVIDKVTGDVASRTIATKPTRAVRDPDTGVGIVTGDVPDDQRDHPCLDAGQLDTLVELARAVERSAERPQDGEFATTADGAVLALQTRPETVWADKDREPVLGGRSAVGAIVDQLSRGPAISQRRDGDD